jgi:RNA polymerase sigma-70 factor (ECF subfamily)
MYKQNKPALNTESKFLIDRLKKGEEIAYELLFKEYYKVLTIFAAKYLKDMEASKELVQDFFVHLYEKKENLDINSSLKSYLFRSVHNRCINFINARKIRDRYTEHFNNTTDIRINVLEQDVNVSELENALHSAINKLPPKCKTIFKMNRFDGLSNYEIAEKLTLSKRTVETQISKALKILRVKLQPYMIASSVLFAYLAVHFFNYL